MTDDEAEDMSLSENLQREQVRPTEEAKAFKRLLEKGRYDMYSLTARFGRSEKYIYTRLKLNDMSSASSSVTLLYMVAFPYVYYYLD